MGWVTGIVVYILTWWVVLFAILPLGVVSRHDAGLPNNGSDPGAPVDPKLKKKFITTTWISAVAFILLWLTLHFHWVTLPNLPSS